MTHIELLAPAKDLACGIEAVTHGADAVYIGAPNFSARSAAGNSVDDIAALCDYAHVYGVRIYVAMNTILKDGELKEAERIITRLYDAGIDALIIQDMGVTRLDIPPVALHASTQMDIRTVEKVRFLEAEGFSQVVLARELDIDSIREIAQQSSVALEVFVHGALCVSFSGQCYISAALSGRSANRGECAQYCRMPYSMVDADGNTIVRDKHLLSLKDLNRSGHLEALLDAGASSLKIEGRLKDASYVKNVTAYYRRCLDDIFLHRPEYRRSSVGKTATAFVPAPEKSFNRGFTPYFFSDEKADITSFDTPKSTGEMIGKVLDVKGNSFSFESSAPLHNGDGIVFLTPDGLDGFRINKVEDNRAHLQEMHPDLSPGTSIYRNYDHEFEKLLSKPSAKRKIDAEITFSDTADGFSIRISDEANAAIDLSFPLQKEAAVSSQEENIRRQLGKLGNTPFEATSIDLRMSADFFIPSSVLAEMRRKCIDLLVERKKEMHRQNRQTRIAPTAMPESFLPNTQRITWQWNVANSKAEAFYREHGATDIEKAFEILPRRDAPLMFTKHCLRRSLGWCKKQAPYREPFFLVCKNIRLKLQFDCHNCQMLIFVT
jgi:putative protease